LGRGRGRKRKRRSGYIFGSTKAEAGMEGKSCGARTKRRWRGLAAAARVLIVAACSAVMHWT
jgi:hypothetical protein